MATAEFDLQLLNPWNYKINRKLSGDLTLLKVNLSLNLKEIVIRYEDSNKKTFSLMRILDS